MSSRRTPGSRSAPFVQHCLPHRARKRSRGKPGMTTDGKPGMYIGSTGRPGMTADGRPGMTADGCRVRARGKGESSRLRHPRPLVIPANAGIPGTGPASRPTGSRGKHGIPGQARDDVDSKRRMTADGSPGMTPPWPAHGQRTRPRRWSEGVGVHGRWVGVGASPSAGSQLVRRSRASGSGQGRRHPPATGIRRNPHPPESDATPPIGTRRNPHRKQIHNRGSTGSDSRASTPNTASWTRHSGSPATSRSTASSPSAYSRSASERFRLRLRFRSRSRLSGSV